MGKIERITIESFMTRKVVSVQQDDLFSSLHEKMQLHRIRHLPVVDAQNRVVGIFTYSDLLKACHPRETESGWVFDNDELNQHALAHFMTQDPVTLLPTDSLKAAAEIMARNKYGCIPIVTSDKDKILAGIVSYIDVLRTVAALF